MTEIEKQIIKISKAFGFNPNRILDHIETLPPLETFVPSEALPHTAYCAVIHEQNQPDSYYGMRYCRALTCMLRYLGKNHPSHFNWYGREIFPEALRVSERSIKGLKKIEPAAANSIVAIVAAQLGGFRSGHSLQETISSFYPNEYGFGTLGIASLLATNQEFPEDIRTIICSGDQIMFGPGDKNYSGIPCFRLTVHCDRKLASFQPIGYKTADKTVCIPSFFVP